MIETKRVARISINSYNEAKQQGLEFIEKAVNSQREGLEMITLTPDDLIWTGQNTFCEGLAAGYVGQIRCVQTILESFIGVAEKNKDDKIKMILETCLEIFQAEENALIEGVPIPECKSGGRNG